jgi:hypothetical protein
MHAIKFGVLETTHACTPPLHHTVTRRTWGQAGTRWGPVPDGVVGLVKIKTRQVKWGGYGGAGPGPKPGGCHPLRMTYTPR